MKKTYLYRGAFYIIGLLILALGITLNTKVGLGVTPIISVSYSISAIWNLNFGNITFLLYGTFVFVEIILHIMQNHNLRKREREVLEHANQVNLKLVLLMDVLQLPLSLIFTRFLNLFSDTIPEFQVRYADHVLGSLGGRFVFLLAAVILTGIGAAMSLNMRIIPNPGDGIVQAIADTIKRSVGFTKNCFDLFNITITILISLIFQGHLIGIGLGTVVAVIGVGRVIALFNHFCYKRMEELAGLSTIK